MLMPVRQYVNGEGYRYGFNGKENDNEVKGVGNQQDYGMRIYDPRLGKFLSVDPLTKEYPELSPYQFASNTPIQAIDLDGLEAWNITRQWEKKDIDGFATYAEAEIKKAVADKVKEDCADFSLRLLVGYASANNLPLTFQNSSKESFDASSTKFKSTEQYLTVVKQNVQAKDLLLNTYSIPQNETQAGDMEIMNFSINEGKKVNFNHVVVFEEYKAENPVRSTIAWGNLGASGAGTAVKNQNYNWPRSSYNDGVKNKLKIYTGEMNSRWNVLNPTNMPQPSDSTPPADSTKTSDSTNNNENKDQRNEN
jgi:RHS repeat-associated protein